MVDLNEMEKEAIERLDGVIVEVDLTKEIWIPLQQKLRMFQDWLGNKIKKILDK